MSDAKNTKTFQSEGFCVYFAVMLTLPSRPGDPE